ncbi:MAG: acyltransferase [Cyanobacteria bacterium SBC]|nr:acyltransferase [Cyanobacteria bacterium SBC]
MANFKHLKKLDAVRGFAAFYVLLHHWSTQWTFIPHIWRKALLSFGQEAVMVFFVMSGFVIYLSCARKENLTFRYYFIRRFRRIYFPFFCALLLSSLIFLINNQFLRKFSWEQTLGNLAMLQDIAYLKPGTWFDPFLGNVSLWSLSYEWWFYMIFIGIYYVLAKASHRIYIVLVASVLAYLSYIQFPNQASLILSYFIIWWCGVEAARIFVERKRYTFRSLQPIIVSLLLMCGLTFAPVLSGEDLQPGIYPFLVFRHFVVVLVLILFTWFWYRYQFIAFDRIFGGFAILAPISYAIYLFHYPILIQLKLSSYIPNYWLETTLKLILIFGLSYLVEIKLQPVVNRWLK